jgi:hypothetical protein
LSSSSDHSAITTTAIGVIVLLIIVLVVFLRQARKIPKIIKQKDIVKQGTLCPCLTIVPFFSSTTTSAVKPPICDKQTKKNSQKPVDNDRCSRTPLITH